MLVDASNSNDKMYIHYPVLFPAEMHRIDVLEPFSPEFYVFFLNLKAIL